MGGDAGEQGWANDGVRRSSNLSLMRACACAHSLPAALNVLLRSCVRVATFSDDQPLANPPTSVFVCVCLCVCKHAYVHAYARTHVCVFACVRVLVCHLYRYVSYTGRRDPHKLVVETSADEVWSVDVCMCRYMHVGENASTHVYMYVCMPALCMSAHSPMHTCTHTHAYNTESLLRTSCPVPLRIRLPTPSPHRLLLPFTGCPAAIFGRRRSSL